MYALFGIICTIVFDLITNLGYALIFNISYIDTIIFGMPFMVMHITSNAIIFMTLPLILINLSDSMFSAQLKSEIKGH